MTPRALTTIFVALALLALTPIVDAGEIAAEGTVYGGYYPSDGFTPSTDDLNNSAGRKVTFIGSFHNVTETNGQPHDPNSWSNTRELLEAAWQSEATPFANAQINASAASIASGAWDGQIALWAQHVKGYLDRGENRGVIIAPLQEMNGNWTPYGCDPVNFRAAFIKFVTAFQNLGIDETQVRWAFAPNGWTPPSCGSIADYYPGDQYVDILAFSAYNQGQGQAFNGDPRCFDGTPQWATVYQALHDPTEQLRAIGPTKPIILAQTGAPRSGCGATVQNGGQDQWVRDLFSFAAADRNIAGIIWFNLDKTSWGETDWRIWDGYTATNGWQDGMTRSTTAHRWPLTEWFSPGDIVIQPPPGPCPDGKKCDTAVFVTNGGQWNRHDTLRAGSPVNRFFFGNPGDVPFMGDWDGDGVKTPGLYRQSDGFVYLRNSNTQGNADIEFFFGNPGDVPVVGDWDGDGDDTVSIYRPSEGRFYIINQLGRNGGGLGAAETSFIFGNPGDQPFVGDFDGDGDDTIGLYRVSTGYVYFRNSLDTGVAHFEFYYGNPGDVIMAGDWDGDGDDTVAVYRPSTGTVYLNFANAPGVANYSVFVGSFFGASRA